MVRTVTVDDDICMCSRECVRIAPEAFVIDEDAMVSRPTEAATEADPKLLREAVAACPVSAIEVAES